jgi:sulfatase maturation enzyme AslB (radical SAM superfamily)
MNLTNSNFQNIPWNDITSFGQKTMLETPLFSVSWILGRFCNYNCSYCWPYARSDKVDHYDLEIYKRTIDEIKRQARSNGFTDFHFSFSGGEPTAYKDFLDLIDHYANDIDPKYQSFHMTSNCSPGLKWWKRLVSKLSFLDRASVTASFHAEFANEEEFSEKLLYLIENQVYVTINQVMVPEKFYEYYNRCKRFYNRGIPVTLKPQSNSTATEIVEGYTAEMIEIMQTGFPQHVKHDAVYQIELQDSNGIKYDFDQAERFNAFGFNKFNGWLCNSGYQSVIIRGNEVKRSYSCHDAPLGTIDSGFILFNQPKNCITNSCVSSADSKIPKCIR